MGRRSRRARHRLRARARGAEAASPPARADRERDARDESREHSPLRAADDAVDVDTTGLSIDEVVERITALVPERRT